MKTQSSPNWTPATWRDHQARLAMSLEGPDSPIEKILATEAAGRLCEVPTPLGDNKRWYDNLAGDFAWTAIGHA